jgi:hypothetical protein
LSAATTSPAGEQVEVGALLEHVRCHLGVYVGTERLSDPLALGESGDHFVEAELELADLGAVVDGHADIEVAELDASQSAAQGRDRIGCRARGEDDSQQADRDPRSAQSDHGDAEVRDRDPTSVADGQRADRDQAAEHHSGADRPGEDCACGDARHRDAPGGSLRERSRGWAPQQTLRDQVGARGSH